MISAPTAVARPAFSAWPRSSWSVMRLLSTPTQAGKIAELGHLHARCRVDGGEEVGRVGEGNGLVCAVLGDCVVDGALSQTGYGMRAAIDEIG